MMWLLVGVLLVGALIVVFFAWDLLCCRGKRCAALADRLVVEPQLRAARRERNESKLRPSSRRIAR